MLPVKIEIFSRKYDTGNFNKDFYHRYFLSNIHRVSDPEFLPENKDILQIRVKTTGVIEYTFVNEEDKKEFIMVKYFADTKQF